MEITMNEFVSKMILSNTINAAFRRGNVYKSNISISENEKKKLRQNIERELKNLSRKYTNEIQDSPHIRHINALAKKISYNNSRILNNDKLRIGTAQKLLNLYLKYLWCLNVIAKPPHCPIDNLILKEIEYDESTWTELNSIEDYK
jgi:hypothetical protein